jgi:hypothetical protein
MMDQPASPTYSPSGKLRNSTNSLKSPQRVKSPPKDVTRYGLIKEPELKFGNEKRFLWQKPATNDVSYNLPEMTMTKSAVFGYALRKGMDEENPDNKKRSTGPGSYDYAGSYDFLSEYVKKEANRFPCAPRQSMAMKTPSPGAVYNIEKKYYTGPEKSMAIGFPNSTRAPLFNNSAGANADMFMPKPEMGPAITIAGKSKQQTKFLNFQTPGPIYDVHVSFFSLICKSMNILLNLIT